MTATTERDDQHPTRKHRTTGRLASHVSVVALAAVLATVPLIWRILAGANQYPAGDAWAYVRIARTYHESGDIQLVGWNDINLIGMLPLSETWSSLFGFGVPQLHALGVPIGVILLLAVASLARRHRPWRTDDDPRRSPDRVHRDTLLAVAIAGVFSGFVAVTGSFQSDHYAAAGALWGIALASRVLDSVDTSSRTALLAMTVGSGLAVFAGFSVRQHAGIAIVVVTMLLWRHRDRLGRAWIVSVVSFCLPAVPFFVWRSSLQDGGGVMLGPAPIAIARALIIMWITIGVVCLPLLLGRRWSHRDTVPAWWAGVVVVPVVLFAIGPAFGVSYQLDQGWSLARFLADHTGGVGWFVGVGVVVASSIGWYLLASLRTEIIGEDVGWSMSDRALVIAILVAGDFTVIFATGAYFERYALLVVVALVTTMIVRSAPLTDAATAPDPTPDDELDATADTRWPALFRPRRLAVPVGLVVLLLTSLWQLDGEIDDSRLLTQLAEAADCGGVDKEAIDAGFIWNGVHYTGVANASFTGPRDLDGLPSTRLQLVFVERTRVAVMIEDIDQVDELLYATEDRSPPDEELAIVGPFTSRGLVPFQRVERWMVTTPDIAVRVERCVESGA